jgi:A/G-specific adenine glycosylase
MHLRTFQRTVFRWYRRHGRTLPWRGIRNPYRILVSEIMLQQTQVSRVLEKYPLFLRSFPTLHDLANANRANVVRCWQGMGYNNRAVRLHVLARIVVERHSGRLPRDAETLRTLPGIGRYTAMAILSSAFEEPVPIVDINIRRLYSRLFWKMSDRSALRPEQEIWPVAGEMLPHRNVYDWNQALMDLGATVCTARTPQCNDCPLTTFCRSRRQIQRPSLRSSSPLRPSSPEPSYRGVPVRILRGRIVETLRGLPEGRQIRVHTLTKRLFDAPTHDDLCWTEQILRRLAKDGLVKIEKNLTTLL